MKQDNKSEIETWLAENKIKKLPGKKARGATDSTWALSKGKGTGGSSFAAASKAATMLTTPDKPLKESLNRKEVSKKQKVKAETPKERHRRLCAGVKVKKRIKKFKKQEIELRKGGKLFAYPESPSEV